MTNTHTETLASKKYHKNEENTHLNKYVGLFSKIYNKLISNCAYGE